jgi:5-methylcytosine-specific restriction enzyme A
VGLARTQGHGNPDWSRDEVILALELYLECGGVVPAGSDPRVIALSELLRGLAIHPPETRVGSFRNPDGVSFKLQNIRQVASGKGLANVSKVDRKVWAAFGEKPAEVKALAAAITTLGASFEPSAEAHIDLDEEFWEGRTLTVSHSRRERRPKVRRLLLASRSRGGPLKCEGCGWTAGPVDAEIAIAAFEAHHLAPLSSLGHSITRLKDMALLCATCHRLVHRWIAKKGEWLTRERIASIVPPFERAAAKI